MMNAPAHGAMKIEKDPRTADMPTAQRVNDRWSALSRRAAGPCDQGE